MTVTGGQSPAAPNSPLADRVLERLTAVYPAAADPERAAPMRAYMKDVAPFLGLTSPVRRDLARTVLRDTPRPGAADCAAIALRCWRLPEREYHYFAVDLLRRHVSVLTSGFLPVVRHVLTTVPWWDTVDPLAAHVVGGLVAAGPGLRTVLDAWIEDDDRWLVRAALLHQLRYQERTDTDRLFGYCRAARTTATSSSARRSAGPCASTPRPTRRRSAASWRGTGSGSLRCRSGRRCGPSGPEPPHRLSNSRAIKNHSTWGKASAIIGVMFRYAFHLVASAAADGPKAAVGGARS